MCVWERGSALVVISPAINGADRYCWLQPANASLFSTAATGCPACWLQQPAETISANMVVVWLHDLQWNNSSSSLLDPWGIGDGRAMSRVAPCSMHIRWTNWGSTPSLQSSVTISTAHESIQGQSAAIPTETLDRNISGVYSGGKRYWGERTGEAGSAHSEPLNRRIETT